MDVEKEKLLEETYRKILRIAWAIDEEPDLGKFFFQDMMLLGTVKDEVFFDIAGMRKLIDTQKAQSVGLELHFETAPLYRRYFNNDTAALIVEGVNVNIKSGIYDMMFYVRSSVLLLLENNVWKLLHWHASKPEETPSEEDTFGINEWKEKNAELEKIVAERTAELTRQKEELERVLKDLRATQTQLIQSEKMASLGELTAGIAHEIQNPLNFVNNFSEINIELLTEMNAAIANKDYEEAGALAKDISENETKITHHGKRADGIVKGMLQHSRSSSAIKEPADINQLADEYLRLAYHGSRAKDKSFNAILKTDFDESLSAGKEGAGLINIIPQDIGRVILNLITNAFYAVDEKKRQTTDSEPPTAQKEYEPTVTVATKRERDKVLVSVSDNGNGISPQIADKIFQPFFTTKPTGQGTGLGLSMSNDIVTKGHGGTFKVDTKEGEGTTFTIILPL